MSAKVKSPGKSRSKANNRPRKNGNKPHQALQKPAPSSQAAAAVAVSQTDDRSSPVLRPADVLALQATMGNAAVQRMLKAQRKRGQAVESVKSAPAQKNRPISTLDAIQTAPATGRTNGSNLIQRAPMGKALVIKKTHLRKPNTAGTAPKKLPAIFNQVGKAISKGKTIELLTTKVMDGPKNVKWQKAIHPDSNKVGFVRMSKVLAKSTPTPATIGASEKATSVEQAGKLTAILSDIVNDGTEVGESIGDMLSARGKTEGDLAEVMLTKPEFANKWFLFSESGNENQAKELVKKDLAGIKDILGEKGQLGFKIGGLTGGLIGDTLGAFGGLLGMIEGCKKYKSSTALGDKIDAALTTGGGLAAITTGVLGGLGKISGFVGDVAKNETVGTVFGTIKEAFGFLGSGVDTVKGTVETVVLVIKKIGEGLRQKGKSAGSKIKAFLEAAGEIASSALGTVKSGIETVAGVLKTIKSLPLVSSILGIVGSVIDLVTGTLDMVKSVYETVKLVIKIKKEKKLEEGLKNPEYESTDGALKTKLERMEQEAQPSGSTVTVKTDKSGIPTIRQEETTLAKYLMYSGTKSTAGQKHAKDVQTHLKDRGLVGTVRKRINRAYSRLPELIVDGVAAGISIAGGLVSIGADIAAVASAPTGVGTAAALATKTIASTVTSVLSGSLKLGKALFKIARVGARKIKQFARDKGWAGANKDKTSGIKLARRKETIKALLLEVASLDPNDARFEDNAQRTQLRLKATGVDLMELFEQNGEPAEQAKMIMEALSARQ